MESIKSGSIIVTILMLLTNSSTTESAQILGIFAHPGKSHFDFFRPLFVGLSSKGHNITMISYFPNKEHIPNYNDMPLTGMPIFSDIVDLKAFDDKTELFPYKIPTFFMLHKWGMDACETAFNSDQIKMVLKSSIRFDVIVLEQFNNDCMMAIAYLLKAPVVALSSCAIMPWHYHRMGSPYIPSFMPMNFLPYTDELNFISRFNNFIHYHVVNILYNLITQRETDKLIQSHFGNKIPAINELVKKTSAMLINQHFSLTGSYPYAPNIVEVGGLQIQDEKKLDPNLQSFLDSSHNGVIIISWGSMIRPDTLPLEKLNIILRSVSQFPDYMFLMKWPNVSLHNKPNNLQTLTWLPQREILCHRNIKGFLSHGGLLGSSEAVYCGVPMIVTPFFGDQFLNAVAIEKRKAGVIVKYNEFTEINIKKALNSILHPEFLKAAKTLSKSFKNRPVQPLDLGIWWIEHVIVSNGEPLAQSYSKHINWWVNNSYDVILFITTVLIVCFAILKISFKLCLLVVKKFKHKKYKKS